MLINLSSAESDKTSSATDDGQTDRQTDERTDGIAVGITPLCIASNGRAVKTSSAADVPFFGKFSTI